MFRIKRKYLLVTCLTCLFSESSLAADVNYYMGFSVGNFSNFNLVQDSLAEDENAFSLNAGTRILEDTANLFVNIDASVQSIKYGNELAPDENVLNLLADAVWRIQPGQFEWVLTDNFAQTAIDTTASDSVLNRQNVNALSTGPNYIIRLNPRNNIQLEARAENYSFEENLDNNRISLAGRLIHNVNSAFIVTLNDQAEITNFEDNVNTDFHRNDIFLSVNYARGLNTLDAEYGVTKITNDDEADLDEDRYALSFTSARTRSSNIRLSYEHLLSDTGSEILDLVVGDSNDGTNGTAANDIFVTESFRFQHLSNLSTGSITFELNSVTTDYRLNPVFDEKINAAIISGVWNLRGADNILYNFSISQNEFLDPSTDREDEDKLASFTYFHAIQRNLNVTFEATRVDRLSTIDSESYEDLRFIMTLTYNSL